MRPWPLASMHVRLSWRSYRLKDHATDAGKDDKNKKSKSKPNEPSTAEQASRMARFPVLLVLPRCMENARFSPPNWPCCPHTVGCGENADGFARFCHFSFGIIRVPLLVPFPRLTYIAMQCIVPIC